MASNVSKNKKGKMASTSASSSYSGPWKYDVFLSFRGETRDQFTSHLYSALRKNQISTFIDENLDKGKDIHVLLQAIEGSAISIIIFSEDFAGSTWCLDEVVKIVDCLETFGQMVLPVFLRIDPSEVTEDDGAFAVAIAKHEERAKLKMEQVTMDKVPKWKEALRIAGFQCGWDSKFTRPESKLVEEIVKDILKKQYEMSPSSQFKNLIGINSRIHQLNLVFQFGSDDICILGIWGMGGIGKTTVAKVLFQRYSKQFEASYFFENVSEKVNKCGLDNVLKELYSRILDEDASTLDLNSSSVRARLQQKRVLIVLDDVVDSLELEELLLGAGGHDSFGSGSKIIITSRDLQVIRNAADKIYKVEELNDNESLQLFSLYAFKHIEPPLDFFQQSKMVLNYCKSNPLALKVLGSALLGRSKREWESVLDGLRNNLDPKIRNVLRVSYDTLEIEEKNIFLDIACFFRGWDRDYVTKILDGCYHSAFFKTSVLIDKSLVTVSNNKLEMHDLLQDLGWSIVCEESTNPAKRSRLWISEDIYKVLKRKKGTQAIEGISFDASKDLQLESDAFKGIDNLKVLIVSSNSGIPKIHFLPYLSYLCDELRYLHWDSFRFKSLPSDFVAENLVMLILTNSELEQLWTGVQDLPKLKRIELQFSSNLTTFPCLSKAENMEYVNLEACTSLSTLPASFQHLKNLEHLNLSGCRRLRNLPSRLDSKFLKILDLSDCPRIENCPQVFGNLEQLNISGTAIKDRSESISTLNSHRVLKLEWCHKLTKLPEVLPCTEELYLCDVFIKELPQSISEHKSLRLLRLINCYKLTKLPELPPSINNLYICKLEIEEVPSSFEPLTGHVDLKIVGCRKLKSLPSNISRVKSIRTLHISDCEKFMSFPEILEPLKDISDLTIQSCKSFKSIPNSICYLQSLENLNLSTTAIDELPSSIEQLHCLKSLFLGNCKNLVALPSGIHKLSSCTLIFIDGCTRLRSLPELPPSLMRLSAFNCISLETISSNSLCSFTLMNFGNCLQLDQTACSFIATDSERQIQLMKSKLPKDRFSFQFIFPGSEIPKLLSNQNVGCSVITQLPSNWDYQLDGMAFCVILEFICSSDVGEVLESLDIKCECRVKTNSLEIIIFELTFPLPVLQNSSESDEVVVVYTPKLKECFKRQGGSLKEESLLSKNSGKDALFYFSVVDLFHRTVEYCKVKSCAVLM